MSTMSTQNSDGPLLSKNTVDEMEGGNLLRTMSEKINRMDCKLDTVLSTMDKLLAAVQYMAPKGTHIDDNDDDDCGFERSSSSYLVINSHNNSQINRPEKSSNSDKPLESPKSDTFWPPLPQSPIYFQAKGVETKTFENLVTVEEGIALEIPAKTADELQTHSEESSDESSDEEDDDEEDDDSESSSSIDVEKGPDDLTLLHQLDQIQDSIEVQKQRLKEISMAPQIIRPVDSNTGIMNFGLPVFTRRVESPLPIAANFRTADYAQCKRKKVAVSDDNRVQFFQKAFKFCTEDDVIDGDQSDVRDRTESLKRDPDEQSDNQSNSASGGFIPNNQLISMSGFKNDHGPKDNRFVEEAHSDTLSFLTTFKSDLPNMKLIHNGIRAASENSADEEQAVGANEMLTGSIGEAGKYRGQDANEMNQSSTSSSLNFSKLTVLPVPDPVQPTNTMPSAKGHSTDDEEEDAVVGDAFIQALLQTQKQEAATNTDPKSQGLDTIICLDLSQSMTGNQLQNAKEAVLAFLDGVEQACVEYELEENVALVTFGKENKIQQHLTNNYDGIREKIDMLNAGGPSPLWLGLALSLTELSTRGGSCKMSSISVLPRIILISDGFATMKNQLSGMDMDVTDDQTSTLVRNLIVRNRDTFSTLDCVTTGVNNKPLLSGISNGRVFTATDIPYLMEFFRVKDVTNECLAKCSGLQMTEQEVVDIIHTYGLQEHRSVDDVKLEVLRNVILSDSPAEIEEETGTSETQSHSNETSLSETVSAEMQKNGMVNTPLNSFENEESRPSVDSTNPAQSTAEARSIPPFGTRVLANPCCEGYEYYKDSIGTVVGYKRDRLKILWSDGQIVRCCYGDNDQYDVRVIDDSQVDNSTLKIGAKVQRGPDWRWKDQDGGKGNIGVVLKVDEEKQVVIVIWPSGTQGNYRNGYKSSYDVKLIESTTHPEEHGEDNLADHTVWQIELNENEWSTFPEEVSQSIEDMYMSKPKNTFLIKTDSISYRISIVQLHARNLETQVVYPIRRVVLPGDKQS